MAIVWECFVSAGRKTGTALPELLPGGNRHGRGVRSQGLLPEGWRGTGNAPGSHPGPAEEGKGEKERGKHGQSEGMVKISIMGVLGLYLHPFPAPAERDICARG